MSVKTFLNTIFEECVQDRDIYNINIGVQKARKMNQCVCTLC